jgi:lysophospholipase L1-like esterase
MLRKLVRLAGKMALALGVGFVFGELVVRALDPPTSRNTRPSALYVPDAALSYTLRSGYDRAAYGADVRINALGFRGPDMQATPSGTRRLVLLGDSIVFGFGVEEDEVLGAQLAAALAGRGARVDVINLGVPGYNLAQEVGVWRRHGANLAPDLVVVVLGRNDADPTIVRDGLRDRRSLGALAYSARRWLRSHSRLIGLLDHAQWTRRMRKAANKSGPVGRPESVPALDDDIRSAFAGSFQQLAADLDRAGLPWVVAWYDPPGALQAEVAQLSSAAGVPYIDLGTGALDPGWRLAWDPHPGPSAHATMGERLAGWLATATPAALGLEP